MRMPICNLGNGVGEHFFLKDDESSERRGESNAVVSSGASTPSGWPLVGMVARLEQETMNGVDSAYHRWHEHCDDK